MPPGPAGGRDTAASLKSLRPAFRHFRPLVPALIRGAVAPASVRPELMCRPRGADFAHAERHRVRPDRSNFNNPIMQSDCVIQPIVEEHSLEASTGANRRSDSMARLRLSR